ncbi:hypothetical protein ES708_25804 [subsurface metagenome]
MMFSFSNINFTSFLSKIIFPVGLLGLSKIINVGFFKSSIKGTIENLNSGSFNLTFKIEE